MMSMRAYRGWLLILASFACSFSALAHDEKTQTGALEGVALVERLGGQLPLDTPLRDERGAEVRLGEFFSGRPVIVAFVYYNCAQLCPLVLQGLARSLRALHLPDDDYQVVAISIDPAETPALAAQKKQSSGVGTNWHYLTGGAEAITALSEAAGFRYRAAEDRGDTNNKREFIHPANTIIASPEGKISRYFSSIDFPPTDLRYSLIEASGNRIGSPLDHLLLLCYRYDAAQGRYTLAILNTLRAAGALTLVAMAGFITLMLRKERAHDAYRAKFKVQSSTRLGRFKDN